MTFRLPFQILRAVSISRPTSPNFLFNPSKIRTEFRRANFSSLVDADNSRKIQQFKNSNLITQNVPSLPTYFPRYCFQHRFKCTNYEQRKNLENRKKVRKQHKCHEKRCERKLIFRQTTREECQQCVGIPVPDKCPKLHRLKPAYDDTALKWDCDLCPAVCDNPQRMDVVKGLKVEPKTLPKLVMNDCERCTQHQPTKAPKLCRPKQNYDPDKMVQDRSHCAKPCGTDPPRMDDIRGYKVEPKKLPKIPANKCIECIMHNPTEGPKLVRPKQRYDAHKMVQDRSYCKTLCEKNPPRSDDVLGLKVEPKKLPILRESDCVKCQLHVPNYAPKLKRPKRKYNPNDMKYQHENCESFCDARSPRMDDVVGYKVQKKSLPKLKVSKCEKCLVPQPKKMPKLSRPPKRFDDSKMKWNHKCVKPCDETIPRMDAVRGYKIQKKKLPKLVPTPECTYCRDAVPTTAPELVPPKRQYNPDKMEQDRTACKPICGVNPPRMDDVLGLKVKPKKLPKLPTNECIECIMVTPKQAPKLERLKPRYDPSKIEQDRSYCKALCEIHPPRMDVVRGLKVENKELPKLKENDCVPCQVHVPNYAPELVRPKRKYNPNDMKYNHANCVNFCQIQPRMDDIVGFKVTAKKLPKLPEPGNCSKCVNHVPKYAPELKRPKRKYDPKKLEKCWTICEDKCDLDPPRMDDVLCWKPKKKQLPSFISSNQTRGYSTVAASSNKISYAIYSHKNYAKLREKAFIYGRRYLKDQRPGDPKPFKFKPTPDCPKACPKFKCEGCKPSHNRRCDDCFDRECVKTEAPYVAYGDCMDGWYEYELSECPNWNEIMLQPQKQVSGHFYKLNPPPPKWSHVDPAIERICRAKQVKKVPLLDEDDKWTNPCTNVKTGKCADRARKHCHVHSPCKPCKKLEAPYKCFSDRRPQFPEIELSECDLADKYKHDCMVNYAGAPVGKINCPDDKETKSRCKPKKPDACTKLPKFMEKKKPVKCTNVEIGGKKYKCKQVEIPSKKSCCGSDDKINAMVCASKDGANKIVCVCKPIAKSSGSRNSSNVPSKSSKTKAKRCGSDKSIKTILCDTKDSSKKLLCLCKSIDCPPKKVSCKKKCPKPQPVCKKPSNSSCGVSDMKIEETKTPSQCELPSPPPQKVPATPNTLWGRICAYFRARPNCPAPHEWKQKELEHKARKAAAAAGLQIYEPKCKYVKFNKKCKEKLPGAKPKNPCCFRPKKKFCCPKPKKNPCCPKPKKTTCCPKPKKTTCCPKPKKKNPCCSKPKKNPCCPPKKKNPCCSKPKENPCCPKPKKPKTCCPPPCPKKSQKKCDTKTADFPSSQKKEKRSKLPDIVCKSATKIQGPAKIPKKEKSSKLPDIVCKPAASAQIKTQDPVKPNEICKSKTSASDPKKSKKSDLIGPVCKPQKKSYVTYVAKKRYFSSYSRNSTVHKQMKRNRKQILTNMNSINSENSLSYSNRSEISNISHSYLRLNNNYVGKIYKLKLTKIGIRNALITRSTDEEPFTICHTCKVIPRHLNLPKTDSTDIKNFKFKLKPVEIKTYK